MHNWNSWIRLLKTKENFLKTMNPFKELEINYRKENPDTTVNYWLMCELKDRKNGYISQ